VNLSVALCGYENRCLTLTDVRRLRAPEYRGLGKIVGPQSEKASGAWEKLRNDEKRINFGKFKMIYLTNARPRCSARN
jgi:hypothetical protein